MAEEITFNPSDWVERFDEKKQKKYWRNKVTKQSTWKNPFENAETADGQDAKRKGGSDGSKEKTNTEQAAGRREEGGEDKASKNDWIEKFDRKKGKKYWKNQTTGETSWKDPNKEESHEHAEAGADPNIAAAIAAAALGTSVNCYCI